MKFKLVRANFISIAFIFLAGCASERNIQLSDNFWQNKQQKIAVATTKAPTPQFYRVGQQGLLDVAINNSMNKDLDKRLERIDLDWYQQLPVSFSDQLKKRNIYAKSYLNQLDPDDDNYQRIAAQIDSDKILVIKLEEIGAKREYFGFIPKGAPEAVCEMTGELIDVKNNQVLWRYKTTAELPVKGNWDQPPNYPNLTNALQLAVNSARQELVDSFFSGH
ncbi:MAG: hypothetical protein EPO11_10490 [Gammaproteobacteria bacterium]|nr:MAG: hypothetical protein EPO11_10490 [Gammaproteobacteria bacterium]